MKVRVFAAVLGDASCLDDAGFLELPEGSKLDAVYRALKIPFPLKYLPLCLVNYKKAGPSTPLSEGDTVSFFALLGGG